MQKIRTLVERNLTSRIDLIAGQTAVYSKRRQEKG